MVRGGRFHTKSLRCFDIIPMLGHAHGRRLSLRARLGLRLACMDMAIRIWHGVGRPKGPDGPLDESLRRDGVDRHRSCGASHVHVR